MLHKNFFPATKAVRSGSPIVPSNRKSLKIAANQSDPNNNTLSNTPTRNWDLNNNEKNINNNHYDTQDHHRKSSKKASPKYAATPNASPTNDETTKGLSRAIRTVRRMTNEELVMLASSDDDFLIDCVLDKIPMVKDLSARRDQLEADVNSLAHCNYAREPQFVNDRDKLRKTLDEVSVLREQLAEKHFNPILDRLRTAQRRLAEEASLLEEESEKMSTQFLESSLDHEQFLGDYIELRKKTSLKKVLSDKMAKELERLTSHITKSLEPCSIITQ